MLMATAVSCAISSAAQDKPLGDVAREARANKTPSPGGKVYTNEDSNAAPPAAPLTAADDPLDVVNKARDLLLRDTAHSCRREASGNSGPGWSDNRFIEVGPDRLHIFTTGGGPKPERTEYIVVNGHVYYRGGMGPWQRPNQIGWDEARLAQFLQAEELPDVLKFGYGRGNLKFMREEAVDGVPAFLYQYLIHAGDMERTISIWVGINDHLPHKTYMLTVTRSALTAPVIWHESTSCTYGVAGDIQPPI
jgi:hypothetical protein